ncbi:hypothetical protein O9993_13120 [Vibrio lentus]|nr:hypothetical protein [Vibrio lentus]
MTVKGEESVTSRKIIKKDEKNAKVVGMSSQAVVFLLTKGLKVS